MHINIKSENIPYCIGIGFLLYVVVIELIAVLYLNSGLLVYTLDDPYIHLALAENIWNGHYGINGSEYSAPSSSILWPLIIAPASRFEYFPFVFNVVASIFTICLFVKILYASVAIANDRLNSLLVSVLVIFLVLATNIIGLLFTGMEHSLQVLLTTLIAYGLIVEVERGRATWWLLSAIVAAPLVRYECMAISIAALIYLLMGGNIRQSLVVVIFLAMSIGGFSLFLTSLGLAPLPTSVLAKSSVVENGWGIQSLIANVEDSLFHQRQGFILGVLAFAFTTYLFFLKDTKRRQLVVSTVLAILMHFMAGKYGWYHRYEIYVLSFALLMSLYIFSPGIKNILGRNAAIYPFSTMGAIGFILLLSGIPYVHSLFTLPIAANNIYEQQYQMHRFAVDYYKQPLAVNDLGYVSYKNKNYVLDLWGLGSKKAFGYRKSENSADWMRGMCNEFNIGLVMIYDGWFKDIPDEWMKVGSLRLGKQRITPAGSRVAFYATSEEDFSDIVNRLRLFVKTLPAGVKFVFQGDGS